MKRSMTWVLSVPPSRRDGIMISNMLQMVARCSVVDADYYISKMTPSLRLDEFQLQSNPSCDLLLQESCFQPHLPHTWIISQLSLGAPADATVWSLLSIFPLIDKRFVQGWTDWGWRDSLCSLKLFFFSLGSPNMPSLRKRRRMDRKERC